METITGVDVLFTPQPGAGPVSSVTAGAGYGSATLSWNAPSTGGPVTTYTITPYIGSSAQPTTTVTGSPAPTSATVTGLTNGTSYTFTVTASNPAGTAAPSPQSNAVTPSTNAPPVFVQQARADAASVPTSGISVPMTSNVTAGNRLVVEVAAWDPSGANTSGVTDSAGDTFTELTSVTASDGTQMSIWTAPITNSGGTRPTITAKPNATSDMAIAVLEYQGMSTAAGSTVLDQLATNSGTTSGAAAVSSGATARTSGTNELALGFYADSGFDDTLGAGSGYSARVNNSPAGDIEILAEDTVLAGPQTPDASVSTGANTTWLMATVVLKTEAMTPPTVPSAPTNVTALPGNGSAQLGWNAPADGGAPISSYTITPYIGSSAQTPAIVSNAPPVSSANVSNLTPGTAYTFTVAATNSVGTGQASAPSNSVTPANLTQPAAPTNVTATAGNASATVSWTAPNNGGSPITSYTVTPETPGNEGTTELTPVQVTGNPPATTVTVTGLTNGTAYLFSVEATNAVNTGNSANSNTVTPATSPGAPTAVNATAGAGAATVTWTPPGDDGGSTITGYTVTPYVGSAAQSSLSVTASGTASSATVPGLTDGTTYTFTVSATNALGTGPPSAPSNPVTPTVAAVPPGTPFGVTATAGTGSVTVSWAAPSDGGSTITSYTVTPYIGSTAGTPTTVSGNPAPTTATVTGLTNGTTYTFTVSATNSVGPGAASGASNLAAPEASAPACPCTLLGSSTPAVVDSGDANAVNLGVAFSVDQPGYITGVRFYKASTNVGTHVGSLWSSTGTLLAQATFTNETASGWQQVSFSSPVAVSVGSTYVASYLDPDGHYSVTNSAFASSNIDSPPVFGLATTTTPNGLYLYGSSSAFPTASYNATNYFVDPVFNLSQTSGNVPGTPSGVTATVGAGSVTVAWTAPSNGGSTITSYTVTPYIGSTAGTPTTVSGNPAPTTATVTGLTNGTTYTFTVSATNSVGPGAASGASNLAAPEASAPACPCTLLGSSTPAVVDSGDANAVNLGVAFSVDQPGYITGVRFYKASTNVGTHVGSLWSSTGTLLAQATFTNETASGWQQVSFSSPVAVSVGSTYVASYLDPDGHYSVTNSAFASSNIDSPPVFGLATTTTPNGLYLYGSSSAFPTASYNATNYFVDPVFNLSQTSGNVPGTPSGVTATVGAGSVTVAWTAPSNGGSTITSYTVTPYIGSTAGTPTTVSGNPAPTTATVTGLTNGTTYTFTVSATNSVGPGAASGASNLAAPEASAPACPCTLLGSSTPAVVDSGDANAVNLGVAFSVDQPGYITGVRFYKASTNVGTHVGSLWSSTGTLLAQATFTNETASGWQQVSFSSPVAVSVGSTYVASYLDPDGHYSVTNSAFASSNIDSPPVFGLATTTTPNGLYLYGSSSAFPTASYNATNYFVDPVFNLSQTSGNVPGTPSGVTATVGAGSVTVAWTAPSNGGSTITSYTVTPYIGSTAGTPTTVSGNPAPTTATVTGLTNGTTYTFTVSATNSVGPGAASGASNLAAPEASAPACPCTLLGSSTPAVVDSGDANAVNLGVAFSVDQPGYITGVRFYKASTNVGTHVGSLWSSTGTLLAQATFTNETASGWQQVSFSSPVAVSVGSTYVASYLDPDGHYSVTNSAFASSNIDSPPVFGLATTTTPNGLYLYGSSSAFPTASYNATNYFVDPVFNLSP